MTAGARNPRNLLTSRIPVLQGLRDSAFDVETLQQKTPRRMQSQECQMQWLWHYRTFPKCCKKSGNFPTDNSN